MEEKQRLYRRVQKRRMGIFVVAVIVVILWGLGYYYTAGSDQKESTVVAAVSGGLSQEQTEALSRQLSGYDPQQRHKTTLRVYDVEQDPQTQVAGLLTELYEGSCDLYLLDQQAWTLLEPENERELVLFEDLREHYPQSQKLVDPYRYDLSDQPFLTATGLEELPDLTASLRSREMEAVNRDATTLENYRLYEELLDNMVYSTPEEGFSAQAMD